MGNSRLGSAACFWLLIGLATPPAASPQTHIPFEEADGRALAVGEQQRLAAEILDELAALLEGQRARALAALAQFGEVARLLDLSTDPNLSQRLLLDRLCNAILGRGCPEKVQKTITPDDVGLAWEAALRKRSLVDDVTVPLAIPAVERAHPNVHFMENSEIFWAKGLRLEAQLAPHIFIGENLHDEKFYQYGGTRMGVSFTPLTKLRMIRALSDPIRTLSFMPKLTGHVIRTRKKDLSDWGDTLRLQGLQLTYGHHSNGKEECLWATDLPDDESDPRCAPNSTTAPFLNVEDGSFSLNYLRGALFLKRLTLGPPETVGNRKRRLIRRALTLGLTLEVNPSWLSLTGGSLANPVLRSLYGANRIGGAVDFGTRYEWAWARKLPRPLGKRPLSSGSVHWSGFGQWIDKAEDRGSHGWQFRGEALWLPESWRGWGLMIRYDAGQDYYNLLFTENLQRWGFGVVFDASELEAFFDPIKRSHRFIRRPTS